MALSHSPRIVTDGLVFAYDMANTQKSWKGRPSTNLVTYSNTLENWSKVPYAQSVTVIDIISNATVAPDGNTTASLIIPRTGVAFNQSLYIYALVGSDVRHTISLYVKYGGFRYAKFGSSTDNRSFDLLSGIWVTSGSDQKSEYCGNGWWRLSANFSIGGGFLHYIWTSDTPSTGGYPSEIVNANGTSGMYIWGCQIELGESATNLLPTNGSITTRTNTQAVVDLTNNSTTTASSLTYASDGAFRFDGGQHISITDNPVFNMTSGLTIEAWVKFDGNSDDFIFEKGDVNTQYSLFSHSTDIVFRTYHSGDGGYHTQSPEKSAVGISNGVWVHIVGSWDGSYKRIFVNGELKNEVAKSGPLVTTSKGSSVGRFGGDTAGYYFNGSIPKIAIYNRGLSALEVQQNFNALRGRYGI